MTHTTKLSHGMALVAIMAGMYDGYGSLPARQDWPNEKAWRAYKSAYRDGLAMRRKDDHNRLASRLALCDN